MTVSLTPPAKNSTLRQKQLGGKILLHLGLTVLALLTLAPLFFMFVLATYDKGQVFSMPVHMWFGDASPLNYQILLEQTNFWRAFWNSTYISIMSVIFTLFFCSLGGYAFAMYEFKGKSVMFSLLLGTVLIPSLLGLVPYYLIMQQIGWVGKPIALYFPGAANAFGIFLMRQYIVSSIPKELMEAARIDGCSEFRIYWNVVLPLLGPVMATLGLTTFIFSWNSFSNALVMLREQETFTLPLVLRSLQGVSNVEWGALLLGTAIATVPLLILFVFTSRQFVSNLTSGAVKG
ncbi:carbohydrate ABC transporter permease [Deinococcus cellulosilyticus]|uniref:Sugar ABC transporter ATP-binding protein n=1 Tax=Deinococcus cellulosilyticus (strain DSM 18568 / NBRC 106333 / KACC 11606 / 5516J-15) TaxID=1223518 RepID=A0A511N371_DEIC1|nr:carbohydrate ABC transporter permease [Deinococcus cellulosilyticus]GEM47309.1 sugar ABC transporter ATP-binding protein [Deinococcus cellulosilyticus NBRC 106333 = KACC 11606]